MAHSKLHIICGNCGSDEFLSFKINPKGNCDNEGVEYPAVFISCGNCSTLHDLADFVEEKTEKED